MYKDGDDGERSAQQRFHVEQVIVAFLVTNVRDFSNERQFTHVSSSPCFIDSSNRKKSKPISAARL